MTTNQRIFKRESVHYRHFIPFYITNPKQVDLELPIHARSKIGVIIDYSLCGLLIQTNSVLFPKQMIYLDYKRKGDFVQAEVVGLRRKKENQTFEYGIQFLDEQNNQSTSLFLYDAIRAIEHI